MSDILLPRWISFPFPESFRSQFRFTSWPAISKMRSESMRRMLKLAKRDGEGVGGSDNVEIS